MRFNFLNSIFFINMQTYLSIVLEFAESYNKGEYFDNLLKKENRRVLEDAFEFFFCSLFGIPCFLGFILGPPYALGAELLGFQYQN